MYNLLVKFKEVKMLSNKKIRELAHKLSFEDIARIFLEKCNDNINLDTSEEEYKAFNRNVNIYFEKFQENLKEHSNGYIFNQSFPSGRGKNWTKNSKNIDFLIELIKNPKGIKKKYLQIDYYGLEHLIQTKLVKEEERLEEQYIIPSKELIDFVISFKTKDGLYPFEDLNESLVVLLISKYPDTWGKTILK